MSPGHIAGPRHDHARLVCDIIVANCRRIRRDEGQSPVAHALARAIQCHSTLPFQRSCSAAEADVSLAHAEHEEAERNWLESVPSLQCALATTFAAGTSSTAASILSCISSELNMLQRNSHASRTLAAIWQDVYSSYSGHLLQWLNCGTVHDASGDFFIYRNADETQTGLTGMPGGHSFSIAWKRLPNFISRENAERIFFAGHVANCILRFDVDCGHRALDSDLSHVSSSTAISDADEVAEAVFRVGNGGRQASVTASHLALRGAEVDIAFEAASMLWRNTASMRMSRLLPQSSIGMYLRSLREYLLLGNEQFWRSFFVQLRSVRHMLRAEMTPSDINAAERALEHAIDLALTETSSSASVPCILRFVVETSGQLSPYFDIPFPASAIIAQSAAKYSQAFAVAFGIRGVVLELELCYGSIVAALRLPASSSWPGSGLSPEQRGMLHRCALLRMRMSRFMQALDDYLQVDVFETVFRSLRGHLESTGNSTRSREILFDDVVVAHNYAVDRWLTESFVDSDAIQRRLDALWEACLSLCQFTNYVVSGHSVSSHEGHLLEATFDRNAELLIRLLSSLQGRIGSAKVSSLLLRLDWDSYFRDFRDGIGPSSRQIFAQDHRLAG
jgi:Gamma tubulin complex component C-terminal